MSERLSNLGYAGLVKETVPGTAQTPTDFVPIYDETINTNLNFEDQKPIFGNKFATFNTLQSTRDHRGDMTVLAEPNTTAKLFDMLLTKVSSTGTNPTTHLFQLTGDSNSYTVDISTGNVVARYFGVKASKIAPNWNKGEMQWKVTVSALGSFQGRALAATPTGSGPYTVALDTAYDPNPTTGLVVGDLIRFYHAPNTTIDATVASIVDGKTITTTTNVSTLVAGDMVYLRPATVAFTLLPTFIFPKTQFRFGATAVLAAAANQVRGEAGSTYEIMHSFESDAGAARFGGFDPAALVRTTGDATFGFKHFFDTPDDIFLMNNLQKTAATISHYSDVGSTRYETRITLNHLTTDGKIVPDLKAGSVLYSDIKYHVDYDQPDGQGFQVTVSNALTTI